MIYFGKHSLALARLNAGGLSPISHRSVFHQDVYDTPARNAMEALAYIGDESALPILENLINDTNTDIRCTARIARDILQFRLKNRVSGAEFSGALVSRNGS